MNVTHRPRAARPRSGRQATKYDLLAIAGALGMNESDRTTSEELSSRILARCAELQRAIARMHYLAPRGAAGPTYIEGIIRDYAEDPTARSAS